MPAETIVGMHVADLLGMESFEQMAKAYLDRCFAGEERQLRRLVTHSFWPALLGGDLLASTA